MLLDLLQLFFAVLVIVFIILQQRGSEGGALFGNQSYLFLKRRGLEKNLYYLTWVLIFFFVLISLFKVIAK